jgi:CheY-like chemotaxis protein
MTDKKILMIVDDDSDDRYFFREAVKQIDASYECLEAQGGIEAFEYLRKADRIPDFIFLDLNMPLMYGWKILVRLKKDPILKNIPVIIYSTSNGDKDKKLTSELGASYFLTKPSDISKLPKEIIKAIKKAEGRSTVRK